MDTNPLNAEMADVRSWLKRLHLSTWLCQVDWVVLVAAVLVAAMLGTLSVLRYAGYNAGMHDLGLMSQSIWSGTQGRLLEFTYRNANLSRLAWHVELFYLFLVPVYALFPSPVTLLILQTLLFVAGAFPLYALALRHLQERGVARAIVLVYLFYPVAQTAVLFDFHGDTLAMPLLLFVVEALDRQAWRAYVVWVFLALSCKFYVAVPVALIGGWLFLHGERRYGAFTILLAGVWGGLAFFVLRPWLTPPEAAVVQSSALGYLEFYFGQLLQGLSGTLLVRVLTGAVVLVPALWLGAYAWDWALLALAIILPVLASNGPGPSYDYRYHHYALAVPLILSAVVYGAARFRQCALLRAQSLEQSTRRLFLWRLAVGVTVLLTIASNSLFVDTPLRAQFWQNLPGQGVHEWVYGRTSRDAFKDRWLSQFVPAEAPLISSSYLAPHVVNRSVLYLFQYPDSSLDVSDPIHLAGRLKRVEYALVDGLFDYAVIFSPEVFRGGLMYDMPAITTLLQDPAFGLVAMQDGLLLFEREPAPEEILLQQVTVFTPTVTPAVSATFGEHISLVSVELQTVERNLWRLRFDWMINRPLAAETPLVAVTRLEGTEHLRLLHLPTAALCPTSIWQPGQVVREEFEVRLPTSLPPGRYTLWTGWYDTASPFAYATDSRSRVGEEAAINVIDILSVWGE